VLARALLRCGTLALVSLIGGCIFVIDGDDMGPRCHFDGESATACGICVAEACQDIIDACCGDAGCAPKLDALDACAGEESEDGGSCVALRTASGEIASLSACVEAACGEVCNGGCSADRDCPDHFGCDDGRCRQRCIQDEECGPYRSCYDFCTDPPGSPCVDYGLNCGGSCVHLDSRSEPVREYCTVSCYSDDPCPAGFACVDYTCYLVR
jgi:hypothetical protein